MNNDSDISIFAKIFPSSIWPEYLARYSGQIEDLRQTVLK